MGELSKLPNIGKIVEEQLVQVGINTADELAQTGSKEAWLRILEIDESACINRLMALEGAIRGVKKNMLLDEVKGDLKAFYKKGNYSGPICIRKTNRRACTKEAIFLYI